MANEFDDKLNSYGFERVEDAADMLHTVISAEGSATFRRGPVRIEVTAWRLGVNNGRVFFSLGRGVELVLCAIVTDLGHRHQGNASRALSDFLAALQEMEYDRVWLQPCPMKKHRPVLDSTALRAWYAKFGFVAHDRDCLVMVLDWATGRSRQC